MEKPGRKQKKLLESMASAIKSLYEHRLRMKRLLKPDDFEHRGLSRVDEIIKHDLEKYGKKCKKVLRKSFSSGSRIIFEEFERALRDVWKGEELALAVDRYWNTVGVFFMTKETEAVNDRVTQRLLDMAIEKLALAWSDDEESDDEDSDEDSDDEEDVFLCDKCGDWHEMQCGKGTDKSPPRYSSRR